MKIEMEWLKQLDEVNGDRVSQVALIKEIQRDAREGTVQVEDVRRAVQFADRYVAAEGEEYMKWLRAKHPNLFPK